MCDILLVTSLCVARETSPVLVGVPLSLAQGLLLCCSKGLSVSSLVALGSGVPQSLQYVGKSSPDAVCMLPSCNNACSTHKLWPGALSSCTVLGVSF